MSDTDMDCGPTQTEKCRTCDGVGGVDLTDSMTLYGVPGGFDYARRCPDCKGTGMASTPENVDSLGS